MKTVDAREIGADYSLTPGGLAQELGDAIETQQPVMIWGPPGIGKSMVAKQVSEKLGREYIDVRALLLDPVDLRGIPYRDQETNRTKWAPPVFLPESDETLMMLDELPAAPPSTQAALYSLVWDREIGEYRMPEGASLIAAGNRVNDRGVAHRMSTALASRFLHLDVTVSVGEWSAWAAKEKVAPEIIFFIAMRNDLLHDFDPKRDELAFPCPRTWAMASKMLEARANRIDASPENERAIFRGLVGEAAAIEFLAFLKIWRDLPHPRTILDNPHGAMVPEDPGPLLATCGALARQADDMTMESIVIYAKRLRAEVGEFLVGQCVQRNPSVQATRAWIGWASSPAAV